MLLSFDDGTPFAIGAIRYEYRPATSWDNVARILLPVEIEDFPITSMVDTAAPWVVCTPEIADILGLESSEGFQLEESLKWHGDLTGSLHRLSITIRGELGRHISVYPTVFVPDSTSAAAWEGGRRPFVLGMSCLEQIRFAIDPGSDTFYFGPLFEPE
jgi:hypothetical protein